MKTMLLSAMLGSLFALSTIAGCSQNMAGARHDRVISGGLNQTPSGGLVPGQTRR